MILEGKPDWAEAWLKEGEERGRKLGEERGIRLGEERGLKLGEERTKRENAVRMLNKGMTVSDVAECVDLPEEEVRRIAADTRH